MMKAKPSVLVVDDQPDNLRILAAILKGEGYNVRKATSGEMALKTIQADRPKLILLDIRMPHMDGYQVCSILKASPETCEIPVIFLSALDDSSDKVKAFTVGGADYITKPFQAEEVLVRIRYQMMLREQQQQLQREIQERQRAEAIVQQLNRTLECQVQIRTNQLQQSLEFEALLKRITDKVRDSLDEQQILQTAIQELAIGLKIECCDTSIYNAELTTATIIDESENCTPSAIDRTIAINETDFYCSLLNQQNIQFCCLPSNVVRPVHEHCAVLACPIFDDQGILGDLRLFRSKGEAFNPIEVRLVKQVANQCAIGIRQARLYEAAQAQVKELKRLNQFKDDFLTTISHELRTPLANIKLVIRLLSKITDKEQASLQQAARTETNYYKVAEYLKILQEECDREVRLIQDLLDLHHLETYVQPLHPNPVVFDIWLPHVLQPFEIRAHSQQQTLIVYLAPDLPPLITDAFCLERILIELVNNACKYTPAGGSITVAAQAHGKLIELSVTNSGIEIAADQLTRIFEKFYRIPDHDPWNQGGTGLGLALIKRLVDRLAGSIQVTSAAGQTCFTLKLPIDAPLISD